MLLQGGCYRDSPHTVECDRNSPHIVKEHGIFTFYMLLSSRLVTHINNTKFSSRMSRVALLKFIFHSTEVYIYIFIFTVLRTTLY